MEKRTLRQLVENTERKDIYLKDYDSYIRFFRQAQEEGFHSADIPRESGFVTVVHSDGSLTGHVSFHHYHAVRYPEQTEIVDYDKFAKGEDNYIFE